MMERVSICYDAFSNGQIDSKLWLCEELERVNFKIYPTVWILGGWYGISAFLLLSRNKLEIKAVRSYDVDPECERIADKINNNWEIKQWKFKAFTKDCNTLDYTDAPDIVINTSTEHFDSLEWFERIPVGTLVCLQGNNMNHEDHFSIFENLSQFKKSFPLSSILFEGEKDFVYPDWKFTRYMLIGIK
jgi:hypothetical protein